MKTRNMQRRAANTITKMKSEFISFGGGLDVVTPPINTNAGSLSDSQNWVVDTAQGYQRINGYERLDGQTAPSLAQYAVIDVSITGSIVAGDTITGVTSAATAVVVNVVTTEGDDELNDYLVITKISGIFVDGEDLNVSAAKEGETRSIATISGASTSELNARFSNLAADEYRSDITAVPGSGSMLGVFVLDDVIFAWRNNAGATAAALYKSTSSGWVEITFGEEVTFTAGNDSVEEGDTLTQGGVTATIDRLIPLSGTSPAIVGRIVISGRSGGSFAAGAATSTGGGALTLDAVETAITMSPSGRFEVIIKNFGGALGESRAYGCDGLNYGWEFDGTTLAPIHTGMMPIDAPKHVIEHRNHLFFSFGPSAQHSGPGTPFIWSPIYGAAEIGVGDTITGFSTEGGGSTGGAALALISRNKMHVLYGTNVTDWNLVPYRDELGGYEWSIQQIGSTIMVDDRGITSLQTSDKFGNFEHSTLSRLIRTWIAERRNTLVASVISREKSQYRLFFGSGSALYVTMDGLKVMGMMPQSLADSATCAWASELSDGTEIILFGSDAGFVYEMEKGTSFDGEAIEHYLVFNFAHFKTPQINKEYFGGFMEISGTGYSEFSFAYELGYSRTTVPQPSATTNTLELSSAAWDSFTWDSFTWDGKTLTPSDFELSGIGENISLIIKGNSDYHTTMKISGAMIKYKLRNEIRYNG